jgi:hypothetical protein
MTVLSIETGGGALRYVRSPLGLALVAAAAGYAFWSRGKKAKPQDEMPIMNQILRIARAHKGRITAAEVLAESSFQLE